MAKAKKQLLDSCHIVVRAEFPRAADEAARAVKACAIAHELAVVGPDPFKAQGPWTDPAGDTRIPFETTLHCRQMKVTGHHEDFGFNLGVLALPANVQVEVVYGDLPTSKDRPKFRGPSAGRAPTTSKGSKTPV